MDNYVVLNPIHSYYDSLHLPKRKTIVITGGNSGVGFAVAKLLARSSWHIVLAIRNSKKGQAAKEEIQSLYPDADISLLPLDLSSKESIAEFVDNIIQQNLDIDVFYSNAGIYRLPYSSPYDKLENHMAVNFASNYLLYIGLRDYLHSLPHPVKWIFTSSIVARFSKIKPADLFGETPYKKARAYNKSKLADNYLYTYLCKAEETSNIIPLLVHPGCTYTPLIEKAYPGKVLSIAVRRFLRLFTHKPDKAALSTCYLLQESIASPCFCGPRGIGHISGYPKIYPLYQGNITDVDAFMAALEDALKE